MFQLVRIDSEKTESDATVILNKWPFAVGRNPGADWVVESPGVWDSHGSFELDDSGRPVFKCRPDASCWLNDQVTGQTSGLKPGDVLKLGSIAVRFDLLPVDQKNAFLPEILLCSLIFLFVASQFYFIYQFLSE